MPTILGINILVFLGWQVALEAPSLLRFFETHFLVSADRLADGYFWTLLTSVFSHNLLWHLLINMIVLYSFGSVLERLWGARFFTAFYLAAGIVASLGHVFVSSVILDEAYMPALGASGAIAGILMAFALMFPRQKILIFGIIPIPALVGALAFVALDVWGVIAQRGGGGLPIGHGAHLGGAAFGAVMYFAYLRPRLRPRAPGRSPWTESRSPTFPISSDEAQELARLREKIDREGPESLSSKEREFLLRLRDRFQSV